MIFVMLITQCTALEYSHSDVLQASIVSRTSYCTVALCLDRYRYLSIRNNKKCNSMYFSMGRFSKLDVAQLKKIAFKVNYFVYQSA